MTKNFIFISPTFPDNYYQFPRAWKNLGGNALCIGEDYYDSLPQHFKDSCTEYYQVTNLHDYDQMYRAVAWFAHKYGKIDWLESNNEYWLEQDARLRTDFNITSGDNSTSVARFKTKSAMKAFYEKAGCPVARYHLTTTYEEGKKFCDLVGYPIVAKPNGGVGASATWKISNDDELKAFYEKDIKAQYIMEEFVPGDILSFDGITDQDGNIIFKTSQEYPDPIMNIVNEVADSWFWSERKIPTKLDTIGCKVIKEFGIKARFFHTEYFRLYEDKEGLGKKGDIVGLEVNMRPPGGNIPDIMNFANNIDVYDIYAHMCWDNSNTYKSDRPYSCVYYGKRDANSYVHNDAEIQAKYGDAICMHSRLDNILNEAMGNEFYIARFSSVKESKAFAKFVAEKVKPQ